MLIINGFKIIRKIELIGDELSYILCIKHLFPIDHTFKPFSYSDITRPVIFNENTAPRYLGVIGFNIENRIRHPFCDGTMMLFLPIGFMQFADRTVSGIIDIFFRIILFNTEKNLVCDIIPKNPYFGFSIVEIWSHCIDHILMLFFRCIA